MAGKKPVFYYIATHKRNSNSLHEFQPITKRRLMFGRDLECDLRIPNKRVSSKHCSLTVASDGQVVLKPESDSVTRLNGEVVYLSIVKHLDTIEIEKFKIMIVYPVGTPHHPPRCKKECATPEIFGRHFGNQEDIKQSLSLKTSTPGDAVLARNNLPGTSKKTGTEGLVNINPSLLSPTAKLLNTSKSSNDFEKPASTSTPLKFFDSNSKSKQASSSSLSNATRSPIRNSPLSKHKSHLQKQNSPSRRRLQRSVSLDPREKVRRVSFGPDLSPERFDKTLPANSPLQRGALPPPKVKSKSIGGNFEWLDLIKKTSDGSSTRVGTPFVPRSAYKKMGSSLLESLSEKNEQGADTQTGSFYGGKKSCKSTGSENQKAVKCLSTPKSLPLSVKSTVNKTPALQNSRSSTPQSKKVLNMSAKREFVSPNSNQSKSPDSPKNSSARLPASALKFSPEQQCKLKGKKTLVSSDSTNRFSMRHKPSVSIKFRIKGRKSARQNSVPVSKVSPITRANNKRKAVIGSDLEPRVPKMLKHSPEVNSSSKKSKTLPTQNTEVSISVQRNLKRKSSDKLTEMIEGQVMKPKKRKISTIKDHRKQTKQSGIHTVSSALNQGASRKTRSTKVEKQVTSTQIEKEPETNKGNKRGRKVDSKATISLSTTAEIPAVSSPLKTRTRRGKINSSAQKMVAKKKSIVKAAELSQESTKASKRKVKKQRKKSPIRATAGHSTLSTQGNTSRVLNRKDPKVKSVTRVSLKKVMSVSLRRVGKNYKVVRASLSTQIKGKKPSSVRLTRQQTTQKTITPSSSYKSPDKGTSIVSSSSDGEKPVSPKKFLLDTKKVSPISQRRKGLKSPEKLSGPKNSKQTKTKMSSRSFRKKTESSKTVSPVLQHPNVKLPSISSNMGDKSLVPQVAQVTLKKSPVFLQKKNKKSPVKGSPILKQQKGVKSSNKLSVVSPCKVNEKNANPEKVLPIPPRKKNKRSQPDQENQALQPTPVNVRPVSRRRRGTKTSSISYSPKSKKSSLSLTPVKAKKKVDKKSPVKKVTRSKAKR